MFHHQGVLAERLLEPACPGQQKRFVVEENPCIFGLVRSAKGDALLEVLKRFRILAFFELAKATQGKSGAGMGGQINVVGQCLCGWPIGVGSVLQRSEIPPAIGPLGVEQDCLLIKVYRAREVALGASCGGGRRYVVKVCRGVLRHSQRRHQEQYRQEQHGQEQAGEIPPPHPSGGRVRSPDGLNRGCGRLGKADFSEKAGIGGCHRYQKGKRLFRNEYIDSVGVYRIGYSLGGGYGRVARPQ